jgi:hypothetical protein
VCRKTVRLLVGRGESETASQLPRSWKEKRRETFSKGKATARNTQPAIYDKPEMGERSGGEEPKGHVFGTCHVDPNLSQLGLGAGYQLVTNRLRRLSKLGKRWSARFRQGKACRDVPNEAESVNTIFNIQCIPVYAKNITL